MEKIIPRGLNYADIKPEAIENQIRIVKFTPQATIVEAKPNDVVRFLIQGNGFYDPYSAYIRISVKPSADFLAAEIGNNQWKARLLDRSAHSLFSRVVVRSQGTELERIENYDVLASMINDMIYSHEQQLLHHYEGFPVNMANDQVMPVGYQGGVCSQFRNFFHGSQGTHTTQLGDVGWWKIGAAQENKVLTGLDTNIWDSTENPQASKALQFLQQADSKTGIICVQDGLPIDKETLFGYPDEEGAYLNNAISFQDEITFCLPLYSGILGVLLPDKKLIPMSLLPLELEFTMNPHAFYAAGSSTSLADGRGYTVTRFEIFAHTLFFEQELHRSLESIVAEHGIFIHYNSFYLAPVTTFTSTADSDTPQYAQINSYAKSINSIHFVFLQQGYEASNGPRKLQFLSRRLKRLQIRNGLDLIPSEPISGAVGTSYDGKYSPFLIETYKAWNKMHDPTTDARLYNLNFNIDVAFPVPTNLQKLYQAQAFLPRCQYGISLEGEELGTDKQIITGRKGLMPFDINYQGTVTEAGQTIMLIYTRADYIVYVRPDLVVQRLGV